MDLQKIDTTKPSLSQLLNEAKFTEAKNIINNLRDKGELPYYLDRPFFQSRTYAIYKEFGYEQAKSLNELTKELYPDDPVVSIVDYELHLFEGNTWGQFKSVFPIAGKAIKRYFKVITTDRVMNDDYNPFIGRN